MNPILPSRPDDGIDELFVNESGSVIKAVHDDGSESAVKFSESGRQAVNPLTGKIEQFDSARNKFSVFASSSAGCFMACPFCHLTIKGMKHSRLEEDAVLGNIKDALLRAKELRPEMGSMHMKLSWMGMGEAIARPELVHRASVELAEWVLSNGLAAGLDGVDLGTVMPSSKFAWEKSFAALNEDLKGFPSNPLNVRPDNDGGSNFDAYQGRSPFRMFWSLHSAVSSTRDFLVPGAMDAREAADRLRRWSDECGANVAVHHLALEGVNDSDEETDALAAFCGEYLPGREVRLLRYNHCAKTTERESERFARIAKRLSDALPRVKVQVSPGKEVSAACGQFIVKQFEKSKAARGVEGSGAAKG